jgi:hypothetical protein
VIVLRAYTKGRLKIQSTLKRLEREIKSAKPGSGCREAIMNVSCFGFSLKCPLKHLLGGDVLSPVELDNAPIVK